MQEVFCWLKESDPRNEHNNAKFFVTFCEFWSMHFQTPQAITWHIRCSAYSSELYRGKHRAVSKKFLHDFQSTLYRKNVNLHASTNLPHFGSRVLLTRNKQTLCLSCRQDGNICRWKDENIFTTQQNVRCEVNDQNLFNIFWNKFCVIWGFYSFTNYDWSSGMWCRFDLHLVIHILGKPALLTCRIVKLFELAWRYKQQVLPCGQWVVIHRQSAPTQNDV